LSLWLELDHDASEGRFADILRGVNDRRIERCAIGDDVHKDLRLTIGPLLKPRAIELHYHSLAVAMSGPSVSDRKPLFEDEEALTVVTDGVLLRRDDLRRRLNRRMVWFDVHLKVRAAGWSLVRLAMLKDCNIPASHLATRPPESQFNVAQRNDNSLPAPGGLGRRAHRRVTHNSHIVILEYRRLCLKKPDE
jgi:hypothetical protein